MLPVDDASNVARVGDEYVAKREVRVTDGRYVQLLASGTR
jgi:hypothetical protein